MRVAQVMTRGVVSVEPTTTLKEASEILLRYRVSGAPVVDGGRLVGVLSESDITAKETSDLDGAAPERASYLRREHAAVTVGDAMTQEAVTVEQWEPVWAAADRMIARGVNRLPVVDRTGKLVGIVTRDDVVRAFIRSDDAIATEVQERVLPSVGLGPKALDVAVTDGVVTVTGEVPVLNGQVDCLRRTLRLVPGVVRVRWNVSSPAAV